MKYKYIILAQDNSIYENHRQNAFWILKFHILIIKNGPKIKKRSFYIKRQEENK